MQLEINGEKQTVSGVKTIAHLVAFLELPAPMILIEHNGTALHRSEWPGQMVAEEDRIEILRVAAGG
jgi:thiamine biosynthesis protein ThiS